MTRNKKTLELRRQGFHIIAGSIITALHWYGILTWWADALLLIATYLFFELGKHGMWVARWVVKHYDRKQTLIVGWGAYTFLQGFLIAALLFPPRLAAAAMAIMVLGDGLSTLIGTYYGKHKLEFNKRKSLEGTLAGLITAFLGASLFVPLPIALTGAVTGMLVETMRKPHALLDDNFLIPLCSGIIMTLHVQIALLTIAI